MLRKKIFLFFIAISLFFPELQSGVGKYKVFKKDKYIGSAMYYENGERLYFSLNDIAKYLKAKKYIYSVSSKIMLVIDGKKLSIFKDKVDFNGVESFNILKPAILRGGEYFLATEIFTHLSFARIFEFKIDIDNKNKLIGIYEDINVTSIKFFSYMDKTRVVLYMALPLKYRTEIVGKSLVLTVFDASYVTQSENINVNDGNINQIKATQDPKVLKVTMDMGENFGEYESFTLKDPDRIVVDIKTRKDLTETRIGSVISQQASDNEVLSTSSFVLPDKMKIDGSKKIIIIDPGHGGKDPGGKVIFGKKEKQINLEIAKKLYDLIKKDKKFEVYLTRDSDDFIPLYERSKFANDKKCDIFISIHANAHKNKSEKGFEVYFLSEKATDPWASEVADYENASISYEDGTFDYTGAALVLHSLARNEYINGGSILASYVSRELTKNTPFKNRGIKQAAFYVLRGSYCPGILIETGFMTNKEDKKNLDSTNVQQKIANSIYKGILEYDKYIK
ncbi:MAG: N-acetylmuramoyl-L-alanine amidase [Elusimicrobiota bacterium]